MFTTFHTLSWIYKVLLQSNYENITELFISYYRIFVMHILMPIVFNTLHDNGLRDRTRRRRRLQKEEKDIVT